MSKKILDDIPVLDLFAGPGGLGEGFSSFSPEGRLVRPFRTVLSVEKDDNANRTLRFRSFFRKLSEADQQSVLLRLAASDQPEKMELPKIYGDWPELAKESAAEVLADQSSEERELGSKALPPKTLDRMIRERLDVDRLWALIGGPPCQAYSLVGRSKIRSIQGEAFEKDARHYLYKQYLRILEVHRPPVFVMENVKGMLSSKIGGKRIVHQILSDLSEPKGRDGRGYRLFPFVKPTDIDELSDPAFRKFSDPGLYVIRAEQHGIPQQRHRVIILGIRDDIVVRPEYLIPDRKRVSFHDVTRDLPAIRSRLSKHPSLSNRDSSEDWGKAWADAVRQVADYMSSDIDRQLRHHVKAKLEQVDGLLKPGLPAMKYRKVKISRLIDEYYRQLRSPYLFHHECKAHMASDLQRYFFYSCFTEEAEQQGRARSPKLEDLPESLLPAHKNVDRDDPGMTPHKDRFRVQLAGEPASTIVSHISKDGHAFIHPDPLQCRSLSIREAARLQTFPDDYIFWGGNSARYHQVGNAVPPLLARKLAGVVYGILDSVKDHG